MSKTILVLGGTGMLGAPCVRQLQTDGFQVRMLTRDAAKAAQFFDNYDLLACPTVAVSPFPVEQRFPTEIAGEKLTTYIDWMFLTFVVTLVGCPAVSLPCGLTTDALPVGLQLVGRPHSDADLLSAALLLEQALGFDRRVPLDI